MNIKQKKKKKQNVTIFYLLIHPAAGVLIDFKGVT
jgi:hypothetical protein